MQPRTKKPLITWGVIAGIIGIIIIGILAVSPLIPEGRITYGFNNNFGVFPCLITTGASTSNIEIFMENQDDVDVTADFILSANNADVALNGSNEFKASIRKTIMVPIGTQFQTETFYVRPHSNADTISLTLDAKAVNPANAELIHHAQSPTPLVFNKDQSGNYCPEERE